MSKKKPTGKPVGRPALNLPVKPRHFLQIEKLNDFDTAILKARQRLAEIKGIDISKIDQSTAVRFAVRRWVNMEDES